MSGWRETVNAESTHVIVVKRGHYLELGLQMWANSFNFIHVYKTKKKKRCTRLTRTFFIFAFIKLSNIITQFVSMILVRGCVCLLCVALEILLPWAFSGGKVQFLSFFFLFAAKLHMKVQCFLSFFLSFFWFFFISNLTLFKEPEKCKGNAICCTETFNILKWRKVISFMLNAHELFHKGSFGEI